MAYLHGAYAQQESSGLSIAAKSGTLPVYFGVAPVHQLADYTGLTGAPVVMGSPLQARALGYSDAWVDYSLGEAAYVHYIGAADPVGPIVVINALDPAIHRKAQKTEGTVTFAAGRATLTTHKAIAQTVELTGDAAETPVTVNYNSTGTSLVLVDPAGTLSGTVGIEYYEVDVSAVTVQQVADLIRSSISSVYEAAGLVPTLLAAPGWSTDRVVNDALKAASREINGHFNAFVFSDISPTATTVEAAKARKAAELRIGVIESPCWPMVTDGLRVYHLSTLAVAESQRIDVDNGNVPFETVSNKPISITGLVVAGEGGYQPLRLDKQTATQLNAIGIKTATFWGGKYRLWGPHTGSYDYNASNAPEDVFDCGVRMIQYLGNDFQLAYGDEVDKPMHRSRIDSILDAYQEVLDRLVNRGALLHGEIQFVADSNPEDDIMTGQFIFDTSYTAVPAARAIINRYRYTTTGLARLTGGSEEA